MCFHHVVCIWGWLEPKAQERVGKKQEGREDGGESSNYSHNLHLLAGCHVHYILHDKALGCNT